MQRCRGILFNLSPSCSSSTRISFSVFDKWLFKSSIQSANNFPIATGLDVEIESPLASTRVNWALFLSCEIVKLSSCLRFSLTSWYFAEANKPGLPCPSVHQYSTVWGAAVAVSFFSPTTGVTTLAGFFLSFFGNWGQQKQRCRLLLFAVSYCITQHCGFRLCAFCADYITFHDVIR